MYFEMWGFQFSVDLCINIVQFVYFKFFVNLEGIGIQVVFEIFVYVQLEFFAMFNLGND